MSDQWISVKDRTPEMTESTRDAVYSKDVLVACDDGLVTGSIGRYRTDKPGWSGTFGEILNGVTH